MESRNKPSGQTGLWVSILVFIGIVLVILLIGLLNAPTMGGPKVMNNLQTYLVEVRATAIPFMIVIGAVAVVIAFLASRQIRKVWSNVRQRSDLLTGYAFLAPYLLVTLTFTIGVIFFAFYISFTHYDIFTRPSWAGLANYIKAFKGFVDPSQRDFLQALYNVFWYSLLVVPIQTSLAILMAVLLNTNMKMKRFFRTIFYAPSVTSSVVITLIFVWFYLKNGYMNYLFESVLGWVGINFTSINWLGDPRGLIQLIVEAFGGIDTLLPMVFSRTEYCLDGNYGPKHFYDSAHIHGHVPGCSAGYQPNPLRSRPNRWLQWLADILEDHPAVIAAYHLAGRDSGYNRHLAGVRPGLPCNPGRAAKNFADAGVSDFPGSVGYQ